MPTLPILSDGMIGNRKFPVLTSHIIRAERRSVRFSRHELQNGTESVREAESSGTGALRLWIRFPPSGPRTVKTPPPPEYDFSIPSPDLILMRVTGMHRRTGSINQRRSTRFNKPVASSSCHPLLDVNHAGLHGETVISLLPRDMLMESPPRGSSTNRDLIL